MPKSSTTRSDLVMTADNEPSEGAMDDNATEFEEFLSDFDGSDALAPDDVLSAPEAESELDQITRDRDSFKDTALRLQADFENYRKRIAAQHGDEADRAAGRLVESLLPVLDACEAAFAHGVLGIEPIWSQLMGVLQKQGLEALDLAEQPFDPALADAVLHEPADETSAAGPVVIDVLRTGYRWQGKVLRAAMVKVRG